MITKTAPDTAECLLEMELSMVEKLKDACSLEGKYDKPRQCIKKQRRDFAEESELWAFLVVMYR